MPHFRPSLPGIPQAAEPEEDKVDEFDYLTKMAAAQELPTTVQQLRQHLSSGNYSACAPLLTRAKQLLLTLNALIPKVDLPVRHLKLARGTLELGALISIRVKDADSFTRYFQQLQPFYALPSDVLPKDGSNQSKITGLYLLLLLSSGNYGDFHTQLEKLAESGMKLEDDEYIQYPIRLEQAFMEGSYDRVWSQTMGEEVPSEEFRVFSQVLQNTVRREIADCTEKSYNYLPISGAKNLLFLDSEGATVQFAKERGWTIRDNNVFFPKNEQDAAASEKDILSMSPQVIENVLGYAKSLETIV